MSLGAWFYLGRKGRTEGDGMVVPKGEYSTSVSELGCGNPSVAFSISLSVNGPTKQSS